MCIKTLEDEYFVIEGSGNLSDNARIEQYLFEQCKETYDFHVSWMQDLSKTSTKAEFSSIKVNEETAEDIEKGDWKVRW